MSSEPTPTASSCRVRRVVFREVLDEIKKRGLLDQRVVRTMQVMTVGEFDDLEEDLTAGQNFQRLAGRKDLGPSLGA